MPKLNIPEVYRAGVSKIRRLDERSVREIRNALDQAEETPARTENGLEIQRDPDSVAVSAMRSIASTNVEEFKQIARALAGLYIAKSVRDVSVDDFAEDVCDAMEALPEEDLRLPHSEREQFRDKIKTLLGSEFFSIVAKAFDLATDDERTFCDARIFTDLRPVFGARVEDGPDAMVVLHSLRLTYHQGSQRHQQFYVALDDGDLKKLKKLIDRAEAKAKALRPAVKDIRLFGIPKE
jgi:hypothetical protein